jgi:hypothetical protein
MANPHARDSLCAEDLKLPKYEGKEHEGLKAKFAELARPVPPSSFLSLLTALQDAETKVVEAGAHKRIAELEVMLAGLQTEKSKLKSLTVDEVLADDPALANELNKELQEGKWY